MSFTTELSFLTTSPDRNECEVLSSNATAWQQDAASLRTTTASVGGNFPCHSHGSHGSDSHCGPCPISKESSAIVQILLVLADGKVGFLTTRSMKTIQCIKAGKSFFEKCEAAFFPEKLLTDRSDKTQLASANQFSSPHFSFCIHHICGRLGDPINPWSLWNISRCHVLSPKNLRRFFVTPKKKCRDSPHDSMLVYSWFTWLFSYYLSPLSWCFP